MDERASEPGIHCGALKVRLVLAILVSIPGLVSCAEAQDPVHFVDLNLKTAIEDALWISDPTPADLLTLTELRSINSGIVSLAGLEYADNLRELNLRFNRISDVSALSGLRNLRKLVLNNNQLEGISLLSGLKDLQFLDLHGNKISNISPLSGMVNLQKLILHDNRISDLGALSGMKNLNFLDLFGNYIRDLAPLSDLSGLETLVLSANRIRDISDISGLNNLKILSLKLNGLDAISSSVLCDLIHLRRLNVSYNHIGDISGLSCLTSLRELELESNSLLDQAYCSHLQMIFDNNPVLGLESGLSYSPRLTPPGQVSAVGDALRNQVRVSWGEVCNGPNYASHYRVHRATSATGIKTALGEWQTGNSLIDTGLEPGIPHFYWLQTASDSQGVNAGDYSAPVPVRFMGMMHTLYVDDDAVGDLGLGDSAWSDPLEDGTAEHPFDRIQEAIDVSADGVRVIVRPGSYYENIDLLGKQIELTGIDPNEPNSVGFPVIDGAGAGPVVSFTRGEDPNCVLTGFVITRGEGALAGGIYCHGSSPTVTNCLIVGNRASDPNGSAVYCSDSNAVFNHCTIADNVAGTGGAGIVVINSDAVLTNSIVWGNVPQALVLEGDGERLVSFTDIAGVLGPGNIDMDPLLVRPGYWGNAADLSEVLEPGHPEAVWIDGDYHLLSTAGRREPITQSWEQDDIASPCIDAGNPVDPVGDEPIPHGDAVNMGAYGSTAQSSRSG